jgi:tetratricopeptide (TPR) repeat protein
MKKFFKILSRLLILLVIVIVIIAIVPSLRSRAAYHIEQTWIKVNYLLHPPEEEIFTPATQVAEEMQATQQALTALAPSATITQSPDPVMPTTTPTITSTPVPDKVALTGIIYQTQKGFFNYCAPANLYMALTYWGWRGDVNEVGSYLKPFNEDKNVMVYEIADYVEEKTDYSIVTRYGGTLDVLKRLLAAGFPVLIEKGTYTRDLTGKISWMGHFNVISGYDDTTQMIITQDSLISKDYEIPYDTIQKEWRGFNYVFQVIYPADQEERVMSALGEYADEVSSYQIAAQIASDEAVKLTGNDQFHGWFNRGTSLELLQDYFGSASAYDQAFLLLPTLDAANRPWRIMWYETGPYFSYYYTGRYQDVINLATNTIDAATQPYFEESFYWRALAYAALGELDLAKEDFCTSIKYHPNFPPALTQMQSLGMSECP